MDIRDIEYFRVICREESLSRAAKILYLSPQGLSKIVHNMELELGSQLLIRTPAGIRPTESGQVLLDSSDTLISCYEQMCQQIVNIENRNSGSVDLISAYGILRLVTPECIAAFRKQYPDIDFTYREYPDCQVERLFLNKEGNVAFSIAPLDTQLYDVTELERFEIKLLVNRQHPLSKKSSVTIQDLRGEKLYIESSEFKIYHLITQKCRQAGFEPNIIFETSGFSLCHKMCAQNKGISVTVDFIFDDMRQKDLVMIPFSDGKYEWIACMLTRKGEYISDGVHLFHRHIMDWLRGIQSGEVLR